MTDITNITLQQKANLLAHYYCNKNAIEFDELFRTQTDFTEYRNQENGSLERPKIVGQAVEYETGQFVNVEFA